MSTLALFDLDHTLLPIDSDYEWGQFLCRIGAVDAGWFAQRNQAFFAQYQAGTLDPVEYLEFALGTLAQFAPATLHAHRQRFMAEVIDPALLPAARALLRRHAEQAHLIAIITATNRFVTSPIAEAFGVDHLLAATPEIDPNGRITGRLNGQHSSGPGKIVHLQRWLAQRGTPLDTFERVYFYSDSHNDLPLLQLATHPVATNPNAILKAHALRHDWPQLYLFDKR